MPQFGKSPEEIATLIGIPLENWPGNCYAIAHQMVERGVCNGEAVYGQWLGPVAKGSLFSNRPIIRHGWIVDGMKLIDPTRYVFESATPYIHLGLASEPCYDRGCNALLAMMRKPKPMHDPAKAAPVAPQYAAAVNLLMEREGTATLTQDEALWLANCPVDWMDFLAKDIYECLCHMGFKAFIPLDNYRMVLGR